MTTLSLLLQTVKAANRELAEIDPPVSATTLECLARENRLLREELTRLRKAVGK